MMMEITLRMKYFLGKFLKVLKSLGFVKKRCNMSKMVEI